MTSCLFMVKRLINGKRMMVKMGYKMIIKALIMLPQKKKCPFMIIRVFIQDQLTMCAHCTSDT